MPPVNQGFLQQVSSTQTPCYQFGLITEAFLKLEKYSLLSDQTQGELGKRYGKGMSSRAGALPPPQKCPVYASVSSPLGQANEYLPHRLRTEQLPEALRARPGTFQCSMQVSCSSFMHSEFPYELLCKEEKPYF